MKTLVKLSAIASVSIMLVACGGGGGGGGSIAQTDWTVGRADTTTTHSYAAPSTYFGPGTDAERAHTQGWRGQGAAIVVGTINAPAVDSLTFKSMVGSVAPLASITAVANGTGNSPDQVYFAAGTSQDAANKLANNTYNRVYGAIALGDVTSKTVHVVSGTYHKTGEISDATALASFTKIDFGNGSGSVAAATSRDLALGTAYIAGSAAIIGSKFNKLSHTEVVKNMDQSRTTDGAFSLQRALAPKGNLR